jgi:hypothetical protein
LYVLSCPHPVIIQIGSWRDGGNLSGCSIQKSMWYLKKLCCTTKKGRKVQATCPACPHPLDIVTITDIRKAL